jgi:hypothetical protein
MTGGSNRTKNGPTTPGRDHGRTRWARNEDDDDDDQERDGAEHCTLNHPGSTQAVERGCERESEKMRTGQGSVQAEPVTTTTTTVTRNTMGPAPAL